MSPLAFQVAPIRNGWALRHNGQAMATFDTKEEAERAALAVAVRHPANRTAKVDVESEDQPASTVIIY